LDKKELKSILEVYVPKPNVVSWTTIIRGYVQSKWCEDGLTLLKRMRLEGKKPNHVTFAGILRASIELGNLDRGLQIHGLIVRTKYESDILLNNVFLTT